MGLFLLGVLAQVNTTLTHIHSPHGGDDAKISPAVDPAESQIAQPGASTSSLPTAHAATAHKSGAPDGTHGVDTDEGEDIGVAVSRDKRIKTSTLLAQEVLGDESDVVMRGSSDVAIPTRPKKKKKRKKPGDDEFDNLFDGLL